MEDIESVWENLDNSSAESDVFADEEASMRCMYELDFTEMKAICENKFLRDALSDSAQITNEVRNDLLLSLSSKNKSLDMYKLLLAHCITYYKGEWYCYLCMCRQQNVIVAKLHLQDTHSDIALSISDFLNIGKILDMDCEQFFNHGIVIEALLLERYFCVYCQCQLYGLGNIASHINGRRHQGHLNAATMIKSVENVQENLDNVISSMKSDVLYADAEALTKYAYDLDSSTETQAICEDKLSRDPLNDSAQVTNKIARYDFPLSRMSLKRKSVDIYKILLAHCITYYKRQWYCYLCKCRQQNVTMAKHHLHETHSDIKISVSDFLNIDKILDMDCEQFFNHGIVIEALLERYFCVYCQCKIHGLSNIVSHVMGKRHQGHINATTIIKGDIENVQENSDDDTSSVKSKDFADEETLMEHVIEPEPVIKTQIKVNVNDSTFDSKSQWNKSAKTYKYLIAQGITCYKNEWYCYPCNIIFPNIDEAMYHSEQSHSDIKISKFPKYLIKLSDKKCRKFLTHGLVMLRLQKYYCIHCQYTIHDMSKVVSHLKTEGHEHYMWLIKNEVMGSLIEERLCNTTSQYVKDIKAVKSIKQRLHDATSQAEDVKSVEPRLHDVTSQASTACAKHSSVSVDRDTSIEHIKSEDIKSETKKVKTIDQNEQKCTDKVLNPLGGVANSLEIKFTNVYKYFLVHRITRFNKEWYCDLCECTFQRCIKEVEQHLSCANHSDIDKRMSDFLESLADLSDLECRQLLNWGIVMRDLDNFFCAWCQCPMLSYYNIDGHLRGNRHKKCEKVRKNIGSQNLDDTEKKKLPCTSEEDDESNDDTVLDTALFCILCDAFVPISTKRHIVNKQHVLFVELFNQAKYIVKFETGKEIIRPIQLNIRNLDGIVCSKYCNAFTATLTCDKCDKIIEGNDLVNHEMTLHKDTVKSFISSEVNNKTSTFKIKLLVDISSSRFKDYPMFKCSFCNEIIHGVLLLQQHFTKCKHEENMVKLVQIKKEEYNSSNNAKDYLELFEFLSIISWKNDNGTLQATEQPVLYIKIRRRAHTKPNCSIREQFKYVCFICHCALQSTKNIITHFGDKQVHLHQLESTLHKYNLVYRDMYPAPSPKMEHNTLECPKIEPPTDVSGNSRILVRQADNFEIKTSNDSKYECESNKSEESAPRFFMSPEVSADINVLIRNPQLENLSKLVPDEISINALDYYNQIYKKRFLEFEEIMFICKKEALEKIKLSIKVYAQVSGQNLNLYLCLLCNVQHACNVHEFFDHIRSTEHVRHLEMLKKHAGDEKFEQLQELMTYSTSTRTRCYACNMTLPTAMITTHMLSLLHKIKRVQLLVQMENMVEELKALWYSIQYFACVTCNFRYKRKIDFMEHLQRHTSIEYISDNSNFGFCITCATLWYDRKTPTMTYSIHRQKRTHQYLENTKDFAITPLPPTVQKLLKNIDETVAKLFKEAENVLNDPRPIQLKTELEHAFKTYNLPVEMCIFGSRITGLALPNSDIDLYLNFGDENTDLNVIKRRSKRIQNCLRTNSDNWEIELTLERSRTPLIKLRHRLIGLHCDLSFTNGLSVENSKLIKSFNTAYPPCQKLILFLKKWMSLSGLSGSKAITNYALTWLVIFYLQVQYRIPSVADLIKSHNESKIVSGWETGVGSTVPIHIPELPIDELLLGFFRYYGEFDYMHCIVCPLLGKVCYKESFTEQTSLPEAMTLYVSQMSSAKAEYFRIDSSMCVQDPFDLAHNLTKAVPTLMLKRFKQYCNESVTVLHYNITLSTSQKRASSSSKKAKKMRSGET
ncbi:hypothetical protein DMN91_012272 [Ooceraea biroi]|uniref:C2H2-type domain-containing protein n=2 Tax=Ooceraea biroi TaxID=2015173 RepID=A0A3L8D602_OOCBI|nr:uncharacterized protein LOC105286365 [Ooceraea biroi]XP_019889510.2 uncharacterized protein LOC105286365 [Ooceraea biroi]XP_019889512.2 uncharacterized protein LOC105286365 [Ooceraea biroi]RLU15278.1 hypothetical protein DMN91_012272 [Ooceraea biroi]